MRTVSLLAARSIDLVALKDFVQAQGGYWVADSGLGRGVVENGERRVFLSVSSPQLEYDREDLAGIECLLGTEPSSAVIIEIGHAQGASRLAARMATEMLSEFGGVIDAGELPIRLFKGVPEGLLAFGRGGPHPFDGS